MSTAATRNGSLKQARFNKDPTDVSSTPSQQTTTPFALATSFLKSHTASLHPETKTIVEKFHFEFIKLKSYVLTKKNLIQRMETEDDSTPRSCRLNFKLNPSDDISELPEFLELQGETTSLVNDLQKQLKKQVIKHTKMEVKAKEEKIKLHYIKAFCIITQALLAEIGITTGIDAKVHLIIDHLRQDVLKHSGLNHTEFLTKYMELYNIETMPNYALHQVIGADGAPTLAATVNPQDEKIFNHLKNFYVVTWDQYINQYTKNEIGLDIRKLHDDTFQTKKCKDVTMILESKMSADRRTLQALIKSEATIQTRTLQQELSEIKRSLNIPEKNNKRGKGGASRKNKNNPNRTTPRRGRSKERNTEARKNKADESNNASSGDKKNSSKKKKTRFKGKKKPDGRTRRSRSRSRRRH